MVSLALVQAWSEGLKVIFFHLKHTPSLEIIPPHSCYLGMSLVSASPEQPKHQRFSNQSSPTTGGIYTSETDTS